MLLNDEFKLQQSESAAIISMVCPSFEFHASDEETQRSLVELSELLRTLSIKTVASYVQNRKNVEPATMLGIGKLKTIAEEAKEQGITLLVFDFELTARQIKNIKDITKIDVVDRNHIILEIFSQHATTKQSKIQIEIARLQYLLPRLAGLWGHFGKQRGGIGVRGGEGEQQIELDRRIVRENIEKLKKELKDLQISRHEQKKKRQKKAVTAALVGYTNAGKSSLMNRLCRVNVLEEDKLFATLDSTYRTLNPDTHPPMILIDTVGFISNLPNTLIDGFKTTLESAQEADLLLITCDIADPHYEKHLEVTNNVLDELGLKDRDRIIIFTKKDLLKDEMRAKIITRSYPNSFLISAFDAEAIEKLREHIVNYFLDQQQSYELFVPYVNGETHAKVLANTNVNKTTHYDNGTFYKVRVPEFLFEGLNLHPFVLGPKHQYS